MAGVRDLPETCSTREAAKRLKVALSTVQTWVEQGYLEAWKTPGGHRRIPIASIDRLLETGMAQRAVDRPKPFRLLIVEDDPHLCELYEGHIQSWNLPIDYVIAKNGYEGFAKVAAMAPDLLITDLAMPEMDGFKMIRALRGEAATATLPIIVVSGLYPEDIDARGGLPDDVLILSKPVSFSDLQLHVTNCMASQGRFERLANRALIE